MNSFAPVSSIMTRQLLTVNPEESVSHVKAIFDQHRIHHIPVVRYRQIVGIISLHDFDVFMGSMSRFEQDAMLNKHRLEHTAAQEIMKDHLAILEPDDRINVAIEVFLQNRIHALPIVDEGELVGIVTPFDILKKIGAEKPLHPEDVYAEAEYEIAGCKCGQDCATCTN